MVLDSHAALAAAEIAFYSPAFCLSLFVCFRQGFKKNLGWFYLVTISILRIIGASCTVYIATKNDHSASLLETAAITSAIGTAPLLLVLLGFLERINQRMDGQGFGLIVFRPIHLLALAAFILAIVGGVERSDASSYKTGKACLEAASILFLAIYVALSMISTLTFTRKIHIPPSEHNLSLAAVVVLPFVLVRLTYTIAVSFGKPGSNFDATSPNVWFQAFMMFCMEAICVSLYIWAGLSSSKQTPVESHSDASDDGVELGGYVPTEKRHRGPRKQEMGLRDYRPSRLVRNAIERR